jgi:hypothetical protein
MERFIWIDTSRDDMPVEVLRRTFAEDGTQTASEVRSTFLSYAQLPDGRWYPSRWRWTYTNFQDPESSRVEEYHLQFHPNLAADARWFADPTPWLDAAYQAAQDASPHW